MSLHKVSYETDNSLLSKNATFGKSVAYVSAIHLTFVLIGCPATALSLKLLMGKTHKEKLESYKLPVSTMLHNLIKFCATRSPLVSIYRRFAKSLNIDV